MALNRLGAPRKTHIPSNKPLGKLSTYVRAFTLIVPEIRSETVIGKRFGYNHVKHAIKHLCESNKELIELTTKQLVYPQCSSTSSNNMDVINNNNSNRKQSNLHVRHRNLSNRRLVGSIERKSKNSDTHASMKMMNSSEHAPKKKKSNNNSNASRNGNNNNKNKNSKKINHKIVKNKTNKRIQVTTTTKVITTTQHSVRDIDVTESTVPENYDDELDDSSASIPLTSNGQSGFTSDEDYPNDK